MAHVERLRRLRERMEGDLRGNILPFWMRLAVDEVHGGFHGWIGDDLHVDPLAPKGGVLNARILWTYSAALRCFGEAAYRKMADRAFEYLLAHFWDEECGGVFWMLDHQGRPVADRKQTYNLAFGVYGLAEYHRATGSVAAKDRAIQLFRAIETHAADGQWGGYWEARARDWSPLDDVRLSAKDRNSPKSMNTHLHVMEAYANLLRVWDDALLRARLSQLVRLHLDQILDPSTDHLLLFFDERWTAVDRTVSYGHDIEASWLLVEAAELTGDQTLVKQARETACRMARASLGAGFDQVNGGVHFERAAGGALDDDKHWWIQAEAVVGYLSAFELTGDAAFLESAERTWTFIERFLVDAPHGEWRWRVKRDGTPIPELPRVEPWKCPYHNTRAALETIERTRRLSIQSPDAE